MADYPFAHCLDYGESGSGKSTFAATWPKPLLMFIFDPLGKDVPYLRRGIPTEFGYDEQGTPYRQVLSKKDGRLLIQLEYFIDEDPTEPECYERFLGRMHRFQRTEYEQWKSVGLDSVTFMEISARKWHQYKLNPNPQARPGQAGIVRRGEHHEPRQWFAGSTDLLEEMLMVRFGGLPMNVILLAHIDEDKDEAFGTFVRNPKAPGRMRKALAAGYGEFYRQFVQVEKDPRTNKIIGEREYLLQTRPDAVWNASTQIETPDPCPALYQALWANWGQL